MDQETISIEEIKQKSTTSVLFLSLRNFGIQGIAFTGFFLLTILLGPGDVGLFAVVAEIIGILGYFSDVGLSSALIQKNQNPTIKQLRTTFTIQQLLVLTLLLITIVSYPSIAAARNFGNREFWIFISLIFAFLVGSLKTIPSVLLERELNFKKLSSVDIVENTLFYVIAVICAFANFGTYSYAVATFIKSAVGLILIYRLKPWSIGFSFDFASVKDLFKYGIPYQLNTLIAMAKDRISTLFVAGIIGREGFGLISWAQKGPRMPLTLMDSIMKVTFPAFSRLQKDEEFLKKSIQKSIYIISLAVFPALVGIAFISFDLTAVIPKYTKWQPAIIPLYFYATSYLIAAVTTPITNAFNAVGKIIVTTKMMIVWTVLTWIFYPILSIAYGYTGTAIASLIVSSSSLIVWYLAHKYFDVNIIKTILHPVLSTVIMGFALFIVSLFISNHLYSLLSKVFIGFIVYFVYHYIFSKQEIAWLFNQIKCSLVKK